MSLARGSSGGGASELLDELLVELLDKLLLLLLDGSAAGVSSGGGSGTAAPELAGPRPPNVWHPKLPPSSPHQTLKPLDLHQQSAAHLRPRAPELPIPARESCRAGPCAELLLRGKLRQHPGRLAAGAVLSDSWKRPFVVLGVCVRRLRSTS